MKRRTIYQIGTVELSLLLLGVTGCSQTASEQTTENYQPEMAGFSYEELENRKEETQDTLRVWYSKQEQEPLMNAAAIEFEERYGIKVEACLHDEIDYLEQINKATMQESGPDVILTSNDMVAEGVMAGLFEENTNYDDAFWKEHYGEVTKHALTYQGKCYGYPLYFDTYCMVYREAVTTEPQTIQDILEFAVAYEDADNNTTIFNWDGSDPYINSLFVNASTNLFGVDGEKVEEFRVSNEQTLQSLAYFQSLHEYLSMDIENANYRNVKEEMKQETLVYGIIRSDMVKQLEEEIKAYKLSPLPTLTKELPTKASSTTYAGFVSPYSKQTENSQLFGAFLSYEFADRYFEQNGLLSVRADRERKQSEEVFYQQYQKSIPIPKLLQAGDYWTHIQIMFQKIWKGDDVNEAVARLEDTMQQKR